jgi:hypothetical protein
VSDQYLDERGVQKLLEALKPHIEGAGGGGGVGSVSPITNNLLAAIAKGEYVPAEALGMDLFLNTPGLDTFYRYIGPRVSGGTPVRAITKADYMAMSDLEKDADVLYILTDTTRRYPTSLNLMSWEDISKISADGTFKNYFKVGDTKRIYLNGTYWSGQTWANIPIDMVVLGIDHNQDQESPGEHRVHWMIGMLDGKNVCIDPVPREYDAVSSSYGGIISSSRDAVAWKASNMYAISLDGRSSDLPGTYKNIKGILPADLLSVMKPVLKSSLNADRTAMEFVKSYITIPSIGETRGFVSSWHENQFQNGYEYFVKRYDETSNLNVSLTSVDILSGDPKKWWTRTATKLANSIQWYAVAVDGSVAPSSQDISYAIRPLVFT